MTQEEKELLLKELCSRLAYDLWVKYGGYNYVATGYVHGRILLLPNVFSSAAGPCPLIEEVRPYLRPMSSMTEEEKKEFQEYVFESDEIGDVVTLNASDWLNKKMFDYRGLIQMGLALEAHGGMYSEMTCDNCPDKDSCSQSEYVMANCYKLK